MSSSYLSSPLAFIISTLFDLYGLLLMLRFLLQACRADFYNPLSQLIVRLTAVPLGFLRRFIPSIQSQDTVAIILCVILMYAKFALLKLLGVTTVVIGTVVTPIGIISYLGLLVCALADLISLTLSIFLIAIIVQVIISWINPSYYTPAIDIAQTIARPVLRPFQRILPALAGLDLSPLLASLGLIVLKMLLIPPFIYLANF